MPPITRRAEMILADCVENRMDKVGQIRESGDNLELFEDFLIERKSNASTPQFNRNH